jgi:hypothetical protein
MQAISRKLLPVSNRLCHRLISPSFVRPNSTSLLSLSPYLRPSQTRVNTLGIPRQSAYFTMTTQVPPPAMAVEQPWYAAYPEAQSKPDPISRSKVLELLQHGKDDETFVLVDLRRTDCEVRPCGKSISWGLDPDQSRRAAPSRAPSTCLLKASTPRFPRCTRSSRLLASAMSSGTVVSLLLTVSAGKPAVDRGNEAYGFTANLV